MSAWWAQDVGTWIGAFGGAGLGVIGGTLGAVGGALAPKGKARGAVLGTHTALLIVSAATLLTGIAALLMSQPYHVWYPLLLIGGIGTFVLGPLLPVVRNRYREAEQRRLEAEELRRG